MYVPGKGMGQAGCNPGFTLSADGSICESIADFTDGAMCTASTFPFLGTLDATKNYACVPYSPLIGYGVLAVAALLLFKGRR